jgi:hypothetical protein
VFRYYTYIKVKYLNTEFTGEIEMKIFISSMFIVVLFTLESCFSGAANGPKWDPAAFTTYTKVITYDAPPEKVFPLFCPVREYDFMRKWDSFMKYSKSGYAEKNAVFQSNYPSTIFSKSTWVCTKYEPNTALSYTVFLPDTLIMLIEHDIKKLPDGKTKDTVVYSLFGINWLGKIMVKRMIKNDGLQKTSNAISEEVIYYLKYNNKIPKEN